MKLTEIELDELKAWCSKALMLGDGTLQVDAGQLKALIEENSELRQELDQVWDHTCECGRLAVSCGVCEPW